MRLLTESELCGVLSVKRVMIYRLRKRGLPFIRVGKKIVRYDLDAVLSWLKQNELGDIEK